MKLVCTYHALSPRRGGSARSTANMMVHLADLGLRPIVIDGGTDEDREFEEVRDYARQGLVRRVRIPTPRFPLSYACAPFLYAVLRHVNPDLLDIRELYNCLSDISLIFGIVRRKRMVVSPHGSMSPVHESNDLKSAIKKLYRATMGRLYVRFADVFVSNSEVDTREIVRYWRIGPERVVMIPHGIESLPAPTEEEVKDIRQRYHVASPHVMFFGRLHWRKGVQYLLRAMPAIVDALGDVSLTIAGPDDGMYTKLVRLTRALQLDRQVTFTGFLPRRDLINLIASSDLVVNPSNYENFGHSMAEAVQLGKPIVQSFDAPRSEVSLPFVRDGYNGYITRFGDVSQLADAIIHILSDSDLRSRLASNSRKISGEFATWDEVARRYKQLCETLLNHR